MEEYFISEYKLVIVRNILVRYRWNGYLIRYFMLEDLHKRVEIGGKYLEEGGQLVVVVGFGMEDH